MVAVENGEQEIFQGAHESETLNSRKISRELWKYSRPGLLGVVKLMDMMDEEAWNSPNQVLNVAEWMTYHIPTQNEPYRFPNEDGSLSDHQRFYLDSVAWIEKLSKEVDPWYLVNFPPVDQDYSALNKTDEEMGKAIAKAADLLTQRVSDRDTRLKFTLTPENYRKLTTQKEKLAALLLLRCRVSNKVAGAVYSVRSAAKEVGIEYDGKRSLAEVYREVKAVKPDAFREIDRMYLEAKMGDKTTIEWLDGIYRHPLLTSTDTVLVGSTNPVRVDFVKAAESQTASEFLNQAFIEAKNDNQNKRLIVDNKDKSATRLSRKGRLWAKELFEDCLRMGYSSEEMDGEIKRMRKDMKGKSDLVVSRQLLQSLGVRVRREAEKGNRERILKERGWWWQKLGLTPFETNYLMEMELSKRKKTGIEKVSKTVSQLRKEIEVGLGRKIRRAIKQTEGKISRRLRELGIG